MRKSVGLFLCLCLLVGAILALCISAETYGDLTYEISNGSITITGCNQSATSVTIPEKISGYPVTSIGQMAFYSCSSLTSITIPSSVTSIGDNAFYYCSSLVSITVDAKNPSYCIDAQGILYNKSKSTLICCPAGTTRTSIEIPSSVTSIGEGAFYRCSSLTSIEIPSSVTSIGNAAFYYCRSLTSITIPSSVTSIGNYAFSLCSGLTSIEIPSSVTSIGYRAFYCCDSLSIVHYSGDKRMWDKISIGADNDELLSASRYYGWAWNNDISAETMTLYGSATCADGIIQLTPLETWCAGSAWVPEEVDFSRVRTISFSFCAGGGTDAAFAGADGLVLVFSTYMGLGDAGSGLGFPKGQPSFGMESYGIEFDSFANNEPDRHIAVIKNTVTNHVCMLANNCDCVEDNQWHNVNVYISDSGLKLIVDGEQMLSYDGLEKKHLKYIGFSAATGSGMNEHLIKDVHIGFDEIMPYDTRVSSFPYPTYEQTAFEHELQSLISNSAYAEVFSEYLTEHTYAELLEKTINIPVVSDDGITFSIDGEKKVKDALIYIDFSESAQNYIRTVNSEFKSKIVNDGKLANAAFEYLFKAIQTFNMQFNNFQNAYNGEDSYKKTLSTLVLVKTAFTFIDELKVTYTSGEVEYLYKPIGSAQFNLEHEDLVESAIPLKSYSYLTDVYRGTVDETPELYNDINYFIKSGGDTSHLSPEYQQTLKGYSLALKDGLMGFKILAQEGVKKDKLIDLGIDNVAFLAEKYHLPGSDLIISSKKLWKTANTAYDVFKALTGDSIFGPVGVMYKLTKTYLDQVKALYESVANTELYWYATVYYYFEKTNPSGFAQLIDPETGSAAISMVPGNERLGFDYDQTDPVQRAIRNYWDFRTQYIYETIPNQDLRLWLWNICDTMHYIENLDCAAYRNMILEYLLAELNRENGIMGVSFPVEAISAESTLGSVQGTDIYAAGTTATITAICATNAKFVGWTDMESGELVSTDSSYSFPVYHATQLRADFVAGEIQPAALPRILNQPVGATYYAGQTPDNLSVTAVATDGGNIQVKWYKNESPATTGGTYVGSGTNYMPNTNIRGVAYYYAVVSNTLGTQTAICKTNAVKINVNAPVIESILVTKQPTKTAYLTKSVFDDEGMVVTANLSDGTCSVIYDYEYETSYSFGALGETPVTLSYMGFTTTVPVFVTRAGDADGNGSITVKDVVVALYTLLDSEYVDLCDRNEDGVLDLIDILQIIKAAAL